MEMSQAFYTMHEQEKKQKTSECFPSRDTSTGECSAAISTTYTLSVAGIMAAETNKQTKKILKEC